MVTSSLASESDLTSESDMLRLHAVAAPMGGVACSGCDGWGEVQRRRCRWERGVGISSRLQHIIYFFCFAEEGEADGERTAAGRNTRVRKAGGCMGLL